MEVKALAGMSFNPLSRSWRVGSDLGVNYMAYAAR
jgi:2-polyprenyl-3-methyl-5-hydroxy-6-metoxy-1,4-benzoquinol methylase